MFFVAVLLSYFGNGPF